MPTINLLRVRDGHHHARVTFVELFFDLVFVFAITQISHTLLDDLTLRGAFHTALMLMAVWLVWIYTSWATNWLDPDKASVRLLLFAVMLAGLVLSSAIPEAFDGRGLIFATALVLIQVGRTAFILYAVAANDSLFRNFERVIAWLIASGVFWIAGGFAEGDTRIVFWVLALSVDFLGPTVAFWTPGLGRSATSDWNIEVGHMAERCGLFIIIALGESILVVGATFAELEWSAPVIGAFVISFLASVAMWWIYFTTAEAGNSLIAQSADPGRLGRSAYTYMHLPIVAGIIVTAVGDEMVLAHPSGHAEPAAVATIIGGPALYILGTALFKWTLWRRVSIPRGAGLVVLALLVPASDALSPLAVSAATTVVLMFVAAWDTRLAYLARETEGPVAREEGAKG